MTVSTVTRVTLEVVQYDVKLSKIEFYQLFWTAGWLLGTREWCGRDLKKLITRVTSLLSFTPSVPEGPLRGPSGAPRAPRLVPNFRLTSTHVPINPRKPLPLLPATPQKWSKVESSTPKLSYNSFHCYPRHLRSG